MQITRRPLWRYWLATVLPQCMLQGTFETSSRHVWKSLQRACHRSRKTFPRKRAFVVSNKNIPHLIKSSRHKGEHDENYARRNTHTIKGRRLGERRGMRSTPLRQMSVRRIETNVPSNTTNNRNEGESDENHVLHSTNNCEAETNN